MVEEVEEYPYRINHIMEDKDHRLVGDSKVEDRNHSRICSIGDK
jgi:hypothetical protein